MAEQDFHCSIVSMPDQGFFWITFDGELTLGRMTRAHQEFRNHPDYFDGVDELLDFTRTSIRTMSREDVDRIRDYALGQAGAGPGRNVLVVNTELEYGLGRMIAGNLGKTVPEERQICLTIREALDWLRPGQAADLIEEYRRRSASE